MFGFRPFLLIALLLPSLLMAAEDQSVATKLQVLSPAGFSPGPAATDLYDRLTMRPAGVDGDAIWQTKIHTLLQHHFRPGADDPAFIQEDIKAMAEYFARYAEVRDLFQALEDKPWHWQYSAQLAETQVTGTRLQVRSVSVRFDPRAGAQFQFRAACATKIPYCFAAPADVFLHELLHVHAILTTPETFIAQGGLSVHLYPHAHEQDTISAERRLYRAMSQQDQIPRPARNSHSGRRTHTQCVTCLR